MFLDERRNNVGLKMVNNGNPILNMDLMPIIIVRNESIYIIGELATLYEDKFWLNSFLLN